MPALSDSTFKARVERIAREKGEDIGLAGKPRVGAVVVHQGLEARDTANGLGGT